MDEPARAGLVVKEGRRRQPARSPAVLRKAAEERLPLLHLVDPRCTHVPQQPRSKGSVVDGPFADALEAAGVREGVEEVLAERHQTCRVSGRSRVPSCQRLLSLM